MHVKLVCIEILTVTPKKPFSISMWEVSVLICNNFRDVQSKIFYLK